MDIFVLLHCQKIFGIMMLCSRKEISMQEENKDTVLTEEKQ